MSDLRWTNVPPVIVVKSGSTTYDLVELTDAAIGGHRYVSGRIIGHLADAEAAEVLTLAIGRRPSDAEAAS